MLSSNTYQHKHYVGILIRPRCALCENIEQLEQLHYTYFIGSRMQMFDICDECLFFCWKCTYGAAPKFRRQRHANRSSHMPAAIPVQASALMLRRPDRDAVRKQIAGQSESMTSWACSNQTALTAWTALFRDAQRRVQNSHRAQTPQLLPVSWFAKMCTMPKLNF